ncbi:calcium-activated chloride channel regulator 2-like [Mauremys mutica]|uniref:calcium-activated chloride channel regulator 2-like n=1 Tax=Mauremys mutica TaxID=74926 RepID=UPI001D16B903|nr:calcium-activated chloride channel regulator 2-like [Mauremys mutica]
MRCGDGAAAAAGWLLTLLTLAAARGAAVLLQGNGYDGLLVAINPQVPEDQKLLANIKEMITEASFYLFNATQRRVYFQNIKILIPATWKANSYGKPKHESYEKAEVIVAAPYWKHGDEPYTLQYGECGNMGKYIHFTPNFLVNDYLIDVYGSRGRVFVHEWAHLRWGVFDEYNNEKPFYITGQNQVKVTRCASDLTGIYICEKKSCTEGNCVINQLTGLFKEGCAFIPERTQTAKSSIMYMQSLSSVVEFCNEGNHNREAPNLQNRMCDYRSTWDVIISSMDFNNTLPRTNTSLPPPPTFSLLQKRDRVICLVLDVSHSMNGDDRINRLRQAAELYLLQVVEDNSYVGIVTFNNEGEIRSQLRQIVNKDVRKQLASYLPTAAPSGGTNICVGLQLGFEVIKKQDGNIYGSEIILLTAGEDGGIIECFSNVINSGSIIHTIALGPSAAKEVEKLAHETGGLAFFASDRLDSNDLIDGFSAISSGNGDTFSHSIQIESAGERTESYKQFSRTVTIDSTVGKDTFFVVTWQTAEPPRITLLDPNGKNYTNKDFEVNTVLQVARLQIPGIAEVGEWTYALTNTHPSPQALTMTVTSRAANSTIPAINVKAHVSSDRNEYPRSMVVYAQVSQGLSPILGANVTAVIKPETGDPLILELLDNGAGSDVVKNDGVYSRYIYSFSENGRYNLKVRVQQANKTVRAHPTVLWSHSMYIPGYIENGKIQMNPPRPSVISNEDIQTRVGGFSRTASGGSFIMSAVPTRPHTDVFPPCKIIDLHARTANDVIILSWTASGDDLDQGQAASYEIRTSESPLELRDNFDKTMLVNTSDLTPQHAGYKEIFVFKPEAFATENVTIIYVAVRVIDKASLHSDVSNIAQAVKFVPPMDYLTGNIEYSISRIVLLGFGLITAICLITSVTICALKKRKKVVNTETATTLL